MYPRFPSRHVKAENAVSTRKIRYHPAQTVNSTYAMSPETFCDTWRGIVSKRSHRMQFTIGTVHVAHFLLEQIHFAARFLCWRILDAMRHPYVSAMEMRNRYQETESSSRLLLLRPLPLTGSLSCEIGFYPGPLVSPLPSSPMRYFFDASTYSSNVIETGKQSSFAASRF